MAVESDYHKLNESDEQARRLLDITLTLTSSGGPVSSTRLRQLHYPQASEDSFRRLFNRDRQRLSLCGVVIRRTNRPPDEPLWRIDWDASFVTGEPLDPDEAVILDVVCSQLASDPDFPLAEDLRVALAKVDQSFNRATPVSFTKEAQAPDKVTTMVGHSALERHPLEMSYERSDGKRIDRHIAIYGVFSLRGHTYIVGPTLQASDILPDSIRTYRVDRIQSCKEDKRNTYEVPIDFDVTDYVLLPFQMGPTLYYASFHVPQRLVSGIRRTIPSNAQVVIDDGQYVLQVPVSSEEDAARWAIASGLTPLSPASLLTSWKAILRRSLER